MPEFPGRFRLPRLPAAPSAPAEGEMYYDTTQKVILFWNGTVWMQSAGSGGSRGFSFFMTGDDK